MSILCTSVQCCHCINDIQEFMYAIILITYNVPSLLCSLYTSMAVVYGNMRREYMWNKLMKKVSQIIC